MDTVILEVADRASVNARIIRACETGRPEKEAHISFESFDLLWKVLGGNRWALLQSMCGAGALGVRALARRVGRDVRAVHADTRLLLDAGVIDKTDDGKLLFPYRNIKLQAEFNGSEKIAAETEDEGIEVTMC